MLQYSIKKRLQFHLYSFLITNIFLRKIRKINKGMRMRRIMFIKNEVMSSIKINTLSNLILSLLRKIYSQLLIIAIVKI
ncbi:MAG TPA: hypothetical protein DEV59_06895 [Proteus sp.]|nr:hypothetical protein [Proteus sp. (in: enterobacteria)]